MTLLSSFNVFFGRFAFPFFVWHGKGGEATAQIDLKTTEMSKKYSLLCDPYLIWLISCNQQVKI